MMDRTIIGLTEKVIVKGDSGEKVVTARIDTGATNSSIDMQLASQLSLGPIVTTKKVRSTNGSSVRPVVDLTLCLNTKEFTGEFTIADRSHMKYRMLIGQNILKKTRFLIDPIK